MRTTRLFEKNRHRIISDWENPAKPKCYWKWMVSTMQHEYSGRNAILYNASFIDFSSFSGAGLYSDYLEYDLTFLHTQLIVMVLLAGVLYGLSKILSKKIFNLSKKSAYECGFEPFLILTTFVEIGFILVAFIFLIFDLELIFLSAFVVAAGSIGSFGILLLLLYLLTVWLMVFLEINTGVLSWPIWNTYKVAVRYRDTKIAHKITAISYLNHSSFRVFTKFQWQIGRLSSQGITEFFWLLFKPFYRPESRSGYLNTFFYKFSEDFEESSFCWEIEDVAFFKNRKKLFGSFYM